MKIMKNTLDYFFNENNQNYNFLVFFRITTGLFVILLILSITPDFQSLFGKNAIIPSEIQDMGLSPTIITLPRIITFFEKFGVSETTTICYFLVIFVAAALCLIMGFLTRVSALLLLFMQVAFTMGGNFFIYGVDNFTTMSLFYLVVFPVAPQSVDSRLFRKTVGTRNVTPYLRLLQLHICLIYFFCGVNKLVGPNWWNGESIWKAITLPTSDHLFNINYTWLADHHSILTLIGWSTIAVELLYPIFIWIPKTRKLWLFLTISLHLGIAFVLGLHLFSAIMIIWNITAFYFVDKIPIKVRSKDNPLPAAEQVTTEPKAAF